MGLFYERAPVSPDALSAHVQSVHKAATAAGLDVTAASLAAAISPPPAPKSFQSLRFLIAVALQVVIVVAAVLLDVNGHAESSRQLFAMATTLFGVIVGFLGGEAVSP